MDYGYDARVWRNQLDKHFGCLWLWGLLEYDQVLPSPSEASMTNRVRFWRNDCMMIEKKSWQECIFAAHLNIDLTKFCDIFQPGRECANTQIADWNPIPPCHLFKILHKREYLGEEESLLRKIDLRAEDGNCVKMQRDKCRENDFCVRSPSEWIN